MSLIDLDFDYDELDKMQLNLMATDKEVRQSFRSALNRIAKYIKSEQVTIFLSGWASRNQF